MEPLLCYQTFRQQMLEYYTDKGEELPDIYKYEDEYDYPNTNLKKQKSGKKDITINEFQRDSISSSDSENPIFKKNNEIEETTNLLPKYSL